MKNFSYLALATALCLLLCSCNKSEPSDSSQSSSVVTEVSSSDSTDNTDSTTQNYDELYETLYNELSNDIYEDIYKTITRELYVDRYTPPQICGKIDLTLDCEQIVLDRADALKDMLLRYYYGYKTELAFKTEQVEQIKNSVFSKYVTSEEFRSYSEFKELFNNKIYDGYIDMINFDGDGFREKNGILYFSDWDTSGGPRGTGETWYLGYDVEDDRIIGHFAELEYDIGEPEPPTAEHLNDEKNYNFYDIIIQNIDGDYVITEISGPYSFYYKAHAICYNNGLADRSLITNPKVMPKK